MRNVFALLVLGFLFCESVQSQELKEAWAVTGGGSGEDSGTVVVTDHRGGVFVAGKFNSPSFSIGTTTLINSGGTDGFIAKFDTAGNLLWAKPYGGTGNQEISALAVSATDKLYAAGAGFNLAKLDGSGNLLWQSATAVPYPREIVLDSKENIYIGGRGVFSKFSPGGDLRYTKTFPTSTNGSGDFFYLSVDRLDNVHVGIFGASVAWNTGLPTNQNILIEYSSRLWFDSTGVFKGHQQLSSNPNDDLRNYSARYPTEYTYLIVNTPLTTRFTEVFGGNLTGIKSGSGCYKSLKRTNNAVDNANNEFYAGELAYGTLSGTGCLFNYALSFFGKDTLPQTTGKDIFFVKKSGTSVAGLRSTQFSGRTDEVPARLAIDTAAKAVYVIGYWSKAADTARFRFGNAVLTNAGSANTNDVLLLKLGYGSEADARLLVDIGSDRTICYGGSQQLLARVSGGAGGYSYAWSPVTGLSDASIANPTVTPTAPTTYVLTVTDAAGSVARDTVNIAVSYNSHKPTVTLVLGTNPFCEGQSVALRASAGTNYQWTKKASSTTTVGNSAIVYATDTLTVTAANDQGCIGTSDPYTVTVNPRTPVPSVTPAGNAQNTINACAGSPVVLTAQHSQSPVTFLWSTGATSASINAAAAGTYSVTATGASGCVSLPVSRTVVYNGLPTGTLTAAGSTTLCSGDSVQLTINTATTNTVLWSTGATAKSIWVKAAGVYSAQLSNAQGCTSAAANTVSVQVVPRPSPVITQSSNTLTVAPAAASYQWFFNNNAVSGATAQTLVITTGGNYNVTVTDANGCSASAGLAAILRTTNSTLSYQVYPNPAGDKIGIVYNLLQSERVTVSVKNTSGSLLHTVVANAQQPAGQHQYNVSTAGLPKGLVIVEIVVSGKTVSHKLLVL